MEVLASSKKENTWQRTVLKIWLPETREKKPVWDFQVYRTGTRRFSSHMFFLGNFLADPKTRKCHFNNQFFFFHLYSSLENSTTDIASMWVFRRRRARSSEPFVMMIVSFLILRNYPVLLGKLHTVYAFNAQRY